MARIAPSLIPAANFANLGADIARIAPVADLLHLDVMDGHFVPNLTIGPPVIASLRGVTNLYFDCHLMMSNPGDYLEAFKKAGANGTTVHVEVGDTPDHIAHMRDLKLDVGVAISPDTPYEAIADYLDDIDMVTVMTVVPGFGGQQFLERVLPKMHRIRDEIVRRGVAVSIEVDGGITADTAPLAADAGADIFVAGNAILGADDPATAAGELRARIIKAREGQRDHRKNGRR